MASVVLLKQPQYYPWNSPKDACERIPVLPVKQPHFQHCNGPAVAVKINPWVAHSVAPLVSMFDKGLTSLSTLKTLGLHQMKYPMIFFRRHLCVLIGWTNQMAWWRWTSVSRVTPLIGLAMSSKLTCTTLIGTSGCDQLWRSRSRLSLKRLWLTRGPFASLVSFGWFLFVCFVCIFVWTRQGDIWKEVCVCGGWSVLAALFCLG